MGTSSSLYDIGLAVIAVFTQKPDKQIWGERGGWGLYRRTTYTLTSHLRGQRRPPVLLSLKQVAEAAYELPRQKPRRLDTVRCWLLERRAVSPERAAWLPAKSDAVIAPCAVEREPRSPPAPPWFLSGWLSRRQCGCGAHNATLFTRRQASEKKMKCFSRYLPYLFRPPSTILSSTCHTEGRVGRRGCCQGLSCLLWACDTNV